jgi:hypothetical protein
MLERTESRRADRGSPEGAPRDGLSEGRSTEPNVTREEAVDGMQEYIIFEWDV